MLVRSRYQIERRLGAGGMGTVYEAKDTLLSGVSVALKCLWPEAGDAKLLETLVAEFRVLATLHHPLLCRVFDFGRLPASSGLPGAPDRAGMFLSRELVPGADLASVTLAPVGDICTLFAQAAAGLDVLHRAGLRHGDFKPANAIVLPRVGDDRPEVRLIDFGLAASEGTRHGGGTPAYCAPELLRGQAADRRADLYALGITLFQVLAGELPSGKRTGSELWAWHSSGDRPPLMQFRDVAPGLAEVVARLIDPNPERRYPTAAETEAALLRFASADSARAETGPLVLAPLDRGIVTRAEDGVRRRCQGDGGPALIEITGAPGSGRTTVLTELGWRVAIAGIEVVRGAPVHGAAPFATAGPLLSELAAIAGTPPPGLTAAMRASATHFAETAVWLGDLSFPAIIVVDDADLADAGSLRLLRYLAAALPPSSRVAIVVAHPGDGTFGPIASVEVECPALTEDEVGVLTHRACGRDEPTLARRISELTGGNLLHVVATLEELDRRGFRASDTLADVPLPDRLAELASRELARLDAPARELLGALAIVGRETAAALAEVCDRSADDIVETLEGLARTVVRRHDGTFWFARPSLGGALRDDLDPAIAQELHRRAGEKLADRGVAADDPSLVRHQIAAGQRDAVDASISSAVRSVAHAGDHAAALSLGTEALELLEDGHHAGAAVALRVELGEIAQLAGDLERTESLLEPIIAADDAGDELFGRAALALGRALDAGGDAERAADLFRRARGDAAASAMRDLVYSLLRRGESQAALEVVEGKGSGDPHLAVATAYARGVLGLQPGAYDALLAMAERAEESGDQALASAAFHFAGRAAYPTGDWRATRMCHERALVAALAVGDVVRVGVLRMNLAAMDESSGAWGRALEQGAAAVSLLGAAGARTYALIARRNHGQLLLKIGAYEQARRELEIAASEADAMAMPVHAIGIDALLGIIAARQGDVSGGRAMLADARDRFAALGDDNRAAETLIDLAELELDHAGLGGEARGAEACEAAAAYDAVHTHPGRRCRLIAARALAAAIAGDASEARDHLAELAEAESDLSEHGAIAVRAELHQRAARAARLAGEPALANRHATSALSLLGSVATQLLPEQRFAFWQDRRRAELRGELQEAPTTPAFGTSGVLDTALDSPRPISGLALERAFRLLSTYGQLAAEGDPDRLLSLAMEQAVALVGASRGFLLLASPDGSLKMVANRNLPTSQLDSMLMHETAPETMLPGELPYSRTVAEEVFRTGEPIIGDVRTDSRFAGAASVHSLAVPSVLCVPACAGGRVVGALYLESNAAGLSLGTSDARLLAAFGDQIAVLLHEAGLKRQLQQRAEELERARTEVEGLLAERTRLLERRTDELSHAVREVSKLSRQLFADGGAFGLVGASPEMEAVYQVIERVAATDVPVLIIGESGTGKELVARAIHMTSRRSDAPMVAVNCGALPQTLLESELFGHKRGSFTGADRDRRGLFETADGSTLFLDEISETPPRMQAALLRALQEGVVRPVGGTEIQVDVRIVCASNRDLGELAKRGEFREDLLYRLQVVTISIPPLRQRRADIPLLVEHFLAGLRERTNQPELAVSSSALRLLLDFDWPGNVRQLEHALTSAAVMAPQPLLGPDEFNAMLAAGESSVPSAAVRETNERVMILETLERHGWNRSKAARELGIPRRTFYRRLAKYGIQ